MSKEGRISGKYVTGRKKIECNLPVILFQEENNFITYCPALDLSGYGATEAESNKSFEIVLGEYFRYTVNKNSLAEDLKKMGWIIRKNLKRNPIPPSMSKLLETNEDFTRIFNNHEFKKTNRTIDIPALA